MKQVFIVRGLPGTYKSTIARMLVEHEDHVLEAAKIMNMITKEHDFHPDLVKKSHEICQQAFEMLVQQGVERIAVANTSTRYEEFQYYIDSAAKHGYTAVLMVMEQQPHHVQHSPRIGQGQLTKMRKRFEINL